MNKKQIDKIVCEWSLRYGNPMREPDKLVDALTEAFNRAIWAEKNGTLEDCAEVFRKSRLNSFGRLTAIDMIFSLKDST